ncbi:MAG: 50S ribosomal protein L22 [Candidatus Omnitrophota bacterium]|nr:50S ribosomal protein L22 [Candidatus Omnitrophota bacterium]
MVSRAVLKYVRLSPRKFRLIIPLVKGKRAEEAIAILSAVKKKASGYGIDLLKSAIANAKVKVQGIDTSTLYISKLVADPGPMLKRFRAASMGRAGSIHKHTSHLTIELDEIKPQTGHAAGEVKTTAKAAKVKKTKIASAPKKESKEKETAHHKEKKPSAHKK